MEWGAQHFQRGAGGPGPGNKEGEKSKIGKVAGTGINRKKCCNSL